MFFKNLKYKVFLKIDMRHRNKYRISFVFVTLFFGMAFFFRCANPAAPEGGPRDTLPPNIISMTPENFTTNFKAKKVTIEFDEYIQLKDLQKEILISPPLARRPSFTVKGRGFVIEFPGELDSATTYKIDFGKAIVDNNEGNPLLNFSYVFSTGPEIDSLVMSGQVVDAFTGDSLLNAIVLFFDGKADSMSYDSTLFLSQPLSVARTDSSGVFLATNLKDMDYRLYAVMDENGNTSYDVGSDMVGFIDSVYNPATMPPFRIWYNPVRKKIDASPQVRFRVFEEIAVRKQALVQMTRSDRHTLQLEFGARYPEITEIFIDSIEQDRIIRQNSQFGDTVTLWFDASHVPDTLKGHISYVSNDSMNNDTILSRRLNLYYHDLSRATRRQNDGPEPNPFSVEANVSGAVNPHDPIRFTFKYPLRTVQAERISLMKEEKPETDSRRDRRGARSQQQEGVPSEAVWVPAAFSFTQDSSSLLKWNLSAEWEPAGNYELMIPSETFENILGEKNDTLKASFNIMAPEKFSLVTLKIEADSGMQYIIEFLDSQDKPVYRKLFKAAGNPEEDIVIFDYVRSGRYKIKISEDSNGNGKWDGGDLVNRIHPERIAIYKDEEGGIIFETKENWDIELNLDLNAIFGNEQNVRSVSRKGELLQQEGVAGSLETGKEENNGESVETLNHNQEPAEDE